MKVVIVGGVAGGASTATRLRRLSENTKIILVEKSQDISYANCGIPYYIGKIIQDRDKLTIVSKEEFASQFNIDVRIACEVLNIDRKQKRVEILDLVNGNKYWENYDKLVLSPGGNPIRPPIHGINHSRIFTLRNLQDMDLITNFIDQENPKHAIIVGAGFIGLEMAENLHQRGLMVSVVELAKQVMNILDFEMATLLHQHFKTKKVEIYLKDGVQKFVENNQRINVCLQSGRCINTDLVILAIGIKPEIALAQRCGLNIGNLGGIVVNEHLQTNDQDIYALGDATEIKDLISNKPSLIPLANSANKQGRIVAENIINNNKLSYLGTPGTAIAKVFDLSVAFTGNSEKQLKEAGRIYDKIFFHPSSHAGYYPNAYPMIFKLIFQKNNGEILGAQIIGAEGVDKRIDVIASMIHSKKTIYDLATLELAYAPPYSSAKDPVNLAGMLAINQMEGRNQVIFYDELDSYLKENSFLIDVRTPLEYSLGNIAGSINIPFNEIRQRISEIPLNKKIILYCTQGKLSYFALCILKQLGYNQISSLSGGFKLYKLVFSEQENTGIFGKDLIDKRDDLYESRGNTISSLKVDACGLQCPGPMLKLAKAIQNIQIGETLEITASDPGFLNDVASWCLSTKNKLIKTDSQDLKFSAIIQKGDVPNTNSKFQNSANDKTIIVFSSDLDKVLAAFVIANGAVSLGREITLFFTFWGLNVLRKDKSPKLDKSIFDKLFSLMMPKGSKKLTLSKMNFAGLGSKMMRHIMGKKNVASLEEMIETAIDNGVKIIACQMSMDIMGLKKEELIDGVEIGGVVSFLNSAEKADTNLFI